MRSIVVISRLLSTLFRPVYYPMVGMFILFTMTYLNLLPLTFRLWVLGMVYVFTVAMPSLGVLMYRKIQGWHPHELRHQGKRAVPYSIYLLCYGSCMYVMSALHLPRFMMAVIIVSLLIQLVCVIVNVWYKISMHSAGTGGVIGALLAYSMLFGFNPIWWLCGAILLSGLVMTSRMVLRQHTLWQVLGGTLAGVACGIVGVLL